MIEEGCGGHVKIRTTSIRQVPHVMGQPTLDRYDVGEFAWMRRGVISRLRAAHDRLPEEGSRIPVGSGSVSQGSRLLCRGWFVPAAAFDIACARVAETRLRMAPRVQRLRMAPRVQDVRRRSSA